MDLKIRLKTKPKIGQKIFSRQWLIYDQLNLDEIRRIRMEINCNEPPISMIVMDMANWIKLVSSQHEILFAPDNPNQWKIIGAVYNCINKLDQAITQVHYEVIY